MGDAILAARAGDAARALLRVNQLAGAAGPDGNAQVAEHAGHVVIDGVERRLAGHQDLGEKQKDDGRGADAAESGHSQREDEPHAVIMLQQVAGAAEPGEERGDGAEIEPRQIGPTPEAARRARRWIP